jgi:hypothetical protein
LLPGISGPWSFNPDGKLLVGLQAGRLFVADAEDPRARQDFPLPESLSSLRPTPGGIEWDADGVRITGWIKEPGKKPGKPVRVLLNLTAPF